LWEGIRGSTGTVLGLAAETAALHRWAQQPIAEGGGLFQNFKRLLYCTLYR
jgi:hypothetical protein